MADYYPVIAKCIADLGCNTPAARHELYWLARAELEVQLCSLDPAMPDAAITGERVALDEAIRRVEASRRPAVKAAPVQMLTATPPRDHGCQMPVQAAGRLVRTLATLLLGALIVIGSGIILH